MHLTPSDPDISTLVRKIDDKRLDLQPSFQRGEVWGLPKKQRLIDSILRGWHIPPIHVIKVPSSHKEEVLDGQQRLAAIRDFISGHYVFNGSCEPVSQNLVELDGLTFQEFPERYKFHILDFTIRILTISDYAPEEPGELFYRLNQPTNLTSAEQRNAYFGQARQQVKELVDLMEELGYNSSTIGFSNSRMAYDDVIAKVLLSMEFASLNTKITASVVTSRYRDKKGFEQSSVSELEVAIRMFALSFEKEKIKLNKSTLYSWLYFVVSANIEYKVNLDEGLLAYFIDQFERLRKNELSEIGHDGKFSRRFLGTLIDIYDDRASSRVADISSVKLRDICLWGMFVIAFPCPDNKKLLDLEAFIYHLSKQNSQELESELQSFIKYVNWGGDYGNV